MPQTFALFPTRLSLAIGLLVGTLPARDLPVHDAAQLSLALHDAKPGDVIIMKDGTWQNTALQVTHGGEPGHPVEIRAENPGRVILNGSSVLELNAPYVTVDGLLFLKGAVARDAVIQFNSHDCVVRDTAVVDYNPAAFETRYYWVFFRGDNNLVDRCYFKGKSNLEPVIGNELDGSRHNSVTRSFFRDMPYAEANGREIIRVWGPGKYEGKADDGAFFTISGNLFDHADGEGAEIISLKSNHNQVLANTVIATRGCINIRRGDFNVVRGNIILGQNRAGAMGYRMSGEHNLVAGNLAAGCEYGIRVSCGEYIGDALTLGYQPNLKSRGVKNAGSVVPTYPQNRDVTIEGNVLFGNSGPDLDIGATYKNHWPASQQVLLPENCLIRANRIVRPHGGAAIIEPLPETTPPLDRLHFAPNRFEANVLVGGHVTYAPAAAGCQELPLPAGWTPAAELAAFVPLTPDDVGPAWVIARRQAGDRSLDQPENGSEPAGSPAQKHHKKAAREN